MTIGVNKKMGNTKWCNNIHGHLSHLMAVRVHGGRFSAEKLDLLSFYFIFISIATQHFALVNKQMSTYTGE